MSVRAFSIFCESVRHEHTGQETIVGCLPDRLLLPRVQEGQASFANISVYTKVYFSSDEPALPFSIQLRDSEGFTIGKADVTVDIVNVARDSLAGSSEYGLKNSISFTLMTTLPPKFILAEYIRGEDIIVTGTLYFDQSDEPDAKIRAKLDNRISRRKSKKHLLTSGAISSSL